MRIENSNRPNAVASRPRGRAGGGEAFQVTSEGAPARSAALAPGGAVAQLDALLAMQAVGDALQARKRQLRRGRSLLDALEDLRLDLLTGRVREGGVNRLLALLGQAPAEGDPEIAALIDQVEERARVELAKLGHYPR